jgi:hypothetical protein
VRLNAIPAYGRQYKTTEECLKDWNEGKDFKIACGPYFSIRDIAILKADGYREIRIGEFEDGSKSNLHVHITL